MSERSRIEENIRVVRSRRDEHLNAERDYLRQADQYRGQRERVSDPTRTYEHQREMDAKADAARVDADRARRSAASADIEIRNLENELRSLR